MDAEHAEQRKKTVSSTQAAALLGLRPYNDSPTAYDIWAFKTDRAKPPDISDKPAVQIGIAMEPKILDWFQKETGNGVVRNILEKKPEYYLSAQIDGEILREGGTLPSVPVEAKTAGLNGRPVSGEWGEPGTDLVPPLYLVQCQVQMILTGADMGYLAAFLGGIGYRLYEIPRNDVICDTIKEAAVNFWEKHVIPDIPPDSPPSLNVAKMMWREPGSVIDLPEKILPKVDAWLCLNKERLAKEAEEKAAYTEVVSLLGDSEAARLSDGTALTYLRQNRKAYSVAATSYPVLRHKKGGL